MYFPLFGGRDIKPEQRSQINFFEEVHLMRVIEWEVATELQEMLKDSGLPAIAHSCPVRDFPENKLPDSKILPSYYREL